MSVLLPGNSANKSVNDVRQREGQTIYADNMSYACKSDVIFQTIGLPQDDGWTVIQQKV